MSIGILKGLYNTCYIHTFIQELVAETHLEQ